MKYDLKKMTLKDAITFALVISFILCILEFLFQYFYSNENFGDSVISGVIFGMIWFILMIVWYFLFKTLP